MATAEKFIPADAHLLCSIAYSGFVIVLECGIVACERLGGAGQNFSIKQKIEYFVYYKY